MIVLIPKPGSSGKGQFVRRLVPVLCRLGVKVTHDVSDKYDVNLGFTHFTAGGGAKILRLDGVYYNKHSAAHKKSNIKIKKHVDKASGIIYQSKFAKKMCEYYLGKPKCPHAVIHNGIDPNDFANIKPIKSKYKYNILAVAKWRKFKRLKDTIKAFKILNNPKACLWVIGEDSPHQSHPNIKYTGRITGDELARYYKMADACVHISYVDACPNVVIESIGAGVPVVCNNVGGNPEIVKNSGVICNIDKAYNLNHFDPYDCPPIDHKIVADGINTAITGKFDLNRNDLNINHIAEQYKKFFEEILWKTKK